MSESSESESGGDIMAHFQNRTQLGTVSKTETTSDQSTTLPKYQSN